MTTIDTQALRAAAQAAMVEPRGAGDEQRLRALLHFSELATPAAVLALLDLAGADAPAAEDRKKKRSTPDDEACAKWIFDLVLKINGAARRPNWPAWADDVRRLREIDGRTHWEICEMFKWAHGDAFWCANILSPKKLREKWDVLAARRARPAIAERRGKFNPLAEFNNGVPPGDSFGRIIDITPPR